MKAVVLVGGEGTRLRPLTYDIPKPMVPICGMPFVEHQLRLMSRYNVDEVIFSLGYKGNSFEEYFKDGSHLNLKIHYVIEDYPLGTGGAIKNVEKYLGIESFYVFNGDILSNFNLNEIFNIHNKNNSICTIALTPVENPTLYGVVEYDEDNRIHKFTEKPKAEEVRSNMINAGLYVLDPCILKNMEPDKKYSIEREIFPLLLKNKESMYCYNYHDYWMDIGNPQKYLQANKDILMGKLKSGVSLKHGLYIGENVKISEGVKFDKPLWIGDNVKIGKDVELYGPSIIGHNCQIGSFSKVKGSLIWDNSKIGNNTFLDNCIIGRACDIKNGSYVGNLTVVASNSIIEPNK